MGYRTHQTTVEVLFYNKDATRVIFMDLKVWQKSDCNMAWDTATYVCTLSSSTMPRCNSSFPATTPPKNHCAFLETQKGRDKEIQALDIQSTTGAVKNQAVDLILTIVLILYSYTLIK